VKIRVEMYHLQLMKS